ncbi:MAG: hypothetical protein VKJ85_16080 [Prochlorothrix sp.]|nr:hypothetical protein [Prochlorothrix sp.]
MTPKEQILQEIEQVPDSLLTETLDFLLFLKARYAEDFPTPAEASQIAAAQAAYQDGDYVTLDTYEAEQA